MSDEASARIDINATIRGLMDVARVALQPHMAELSKAETIAALEALLAIIDNAMVTGASGDFRESLMEQSPCGQVQLLQDIGASAHDRPAHLEPQGEPTRQAFAKAG